MMLGLVGSLLIAAAVPIVVDHLLKIPAALVQDTKMSFFILASSLPLLLMSAAVRGVLEAGQHFKEVNTVKAPLSASLFLLPALGAALGLGLPWIVLLLVVARPCFVSSSILFYGTIVYSTGRFSLVYCHLAGGLQSQTSSPRY
jgi:hypothetical protein